MDQFTTRLRSARGALIPSLLSAPPCPWPKTARRVLLTGAERADIRCGAPIRQASATDGSKGPLTRWRSAGW